MSDPIFDILFYGVVKPGHDPEQARANLATLFKTDRTRVDRLFSGNEVVIKQGADETTAKRYQAAFAQAGLVCQVRPAAAAADGAFGLAAAGSPLAPESAPPPPAPDTSHLSAAEVGADVLEGVEHAPPPAPPDTSHLNAIDVGDGLLAGVEHAPPPAPPDTSHLSAAEAGADVLEGAAPAPPPPPPDTSHLTTAEVGADLLEEIDSSPPPAPPDTGHLALDDDAPDR